MSQGILDQFWLWSKQALPLNAYESVKAFSETDFSEDLKKFNFPTLVGAPHGLSPTHQDKVSALHLLAFLKGAAKAAA